MKMCENFKIGDLWRKTSLTKKVAVLIILVLSLFFAFVFTMQTFFFGKIYINQKETALKSAIRMLCEDYSKLKSDDEIQQYLTEASNAGSANIMILNSEKEIIYSLSYRMTITDNSGNSVRIILDEMARDRNIYSLNLKNGGSATVEYMYFEDERTDTYFPIKITNQNGEIFTNHIMGPPKSKRDVKEITGKISNLTLPLKNNNFRRIDAMRTLFLWTQNEDAMKEFAEKDSYYEIFEDPQLHSRCMILAKTADNSDIFFGVVPLAYESENHKAFAAITLPWLLLSAVVSLLVAIIFSKQITKPILSISRVTTKMKNLDFSEICNLKGKDELGKLAENINEMSKKLDETIQELLKANKKLTADIERDREIEQQRKEFVAAVSHELKTPLAVIHAYTEGLQDEVSPKNKEKYMRVIIQETEKMDALILSMLENSRLESGMEKLVTKDHDLCALVKNVCKVFEGANHIKFCYDLPEKPLIYSFDIDKIEQVINNFMSNAIKHTKESGSVYIEVKEDNGTCTVSVENEGEAIAEDELDRVWDRFYKSDKSRDRSDGSTGLGLSIAKNILKLHNANYFVENTKKGVKFGFTLRRTDDEQHKES